MSMRTATSHRLRHTILTVSFDERSEKIQAGVKTKGKPRGAISGTCLWTRWRIELRAVPRRCGFVLEATAWSANNWNVPATLIRQTQLINRW